MTEGLTGKRIFFAVGGTGGHILPAVQLATSLRKKGLCDITFIGKDLYDNPYLPQKEFVIQEIESASPLCRNPLKALRRLIPLCKGIRQSYSLCSASPDLVIGFGGFHSFPVLLSAWLCKIPYVLFEPNIQMGVVNRIFARGARSIYSYFPVEGSGYDHKKDHLTARPFSWGEYLAENREQACLQFGLSPYRPVLLIMGGSQGARFLNQIVPACSLPEEFQVIHLCGETENLEALKKFWKWRNVPAYVSSFEKDMASVLQCASIAVCRAGAGTLVDLFHYGVPAVLIPYPYAYAHQQKNAEYFVQMGGGQYILQKDCTTEVLANSLLGLFKNKEAHKHSMSMWQKAGPPRKSFEQYIVEELG